jgi:hypothetical protein
MVISILFFLQQFVWGFPRADQLTVDHSLMLNVWYDPIGVQTCTVYTVQQNKKGLSS